MLSRFGAQSVRHGGCAYQQTRSLGASIPVILLEDMDQGRQGEIVKVKRGFMRNYLAPRKKACYLTDENKARHASLLEKAPVITCKELVLEFGQSLERRPKSFR